MLNSKESIYDIEWAKGYKYGQVRLAEEQQFSKYSFELADIELHFQLTFTIRSRSEKND